MEISRAYRAFNKYILITVLIYSLVEVQCQVSKCCPTGSIPDVQSEFTCKKSMNRAVLNTHNILQPSILNCPDPYNIFLKDQYYIELNGCIDTDSNNELVAVSCSQEWTTGVHLINKCCPFGQVYDHTERFCTQNTDLQGNFKQVFDNSAVVFKNKIPDCSDDDEVFVEYYSATHSIHFDGFNLRVDGADLSPNKFCIDDLVNINSTEFRPNDMNFIVRSCRPRHMCNEIPCFRRCCKTDQVLQKGYKMKKCVPNPEGKNLVPTFYDVQSPVTNPQRQIQLRGMILNK